MKIPQEFIMKNTFLTLVLIAAFCTVSNSAEVFTSSDSPGSLPAEEGVMITGKTNATKFIGTDDWTANTNNAILGSPKLADLNGDGVDEILLPTYGSYLFGWDGAGNALNGFPISLTGSAPGTPAIGDIDNDGDVEIVQGTWNYLYIFNANGTNYPGWPIPLYVTQAAALEDLDNDGDLEIIIPSSSSMYVYHHNGTLFPGFPVTGAHSLTAAGVGDLDGDGTLEIVAGSYVASGSPSDYVYAWNSDGTAVPGFPVITDGSVKVAPALADLDNDGTLEIIADCWNQSAGVNDKLYVWSHTGQLEPGWPLNASYIRLSSPSIADMDQDGDLEIIVGGWSTAPYGEMVFVFHHTGTPLTGFPVVLPNSPSGNVNSTPTVGDIDGDGCLEIVVKVKNYIYALNHDGSIVTGFPVFLDDTNHSGTTSPTPAIGDPDGDGLMEIFAASCYNLVMLIDQPGAFSWEALPWPTFRRDPRNLGIYTPPTPPDIAVMLTPSTTPIVIPANGGSFDFNIEVVNNGASPANFDLWTMATLPDGREYGPIIGPVNLTLDPGVSVNRDRSQSVPGNAPAGNYTYDAYVGNYPNNVWDEDHFDFEKLAASDGGSIISDWANRGEYFSGEVVGEMVGTPAEFILHPAYPNPFNPSTALSFQLSADGFVQLMIFDISGREVVRLADGFRLAGIYETTFDASGLSSGIYFARLRADGFSQTRKMLLVK